MEKDRQCHRNQWKMKYYSDCYCLEGRCYYNKCEGRTWKNKKMTTILKTYKQLTLWENS